MYAMSSRCPSGPRDCRPRRSCACCPKRAAPPRARRRATAVPHLRLISTPAPAEKQPVLLAGSDATLAAAVSARPRRDDAAEHGFEQAGAIWEVLVRAPDCQHGRSSPGELDEIPTEQSLMQMLVQQSPRSRSSAWTRRRVAQVDVRWRRSHRPLSARRTPALLRRHRSATRRVSPRRDRGYILQAVTAAHQQRVACAAMSAATATSPLRYPELRRIVAGYTVNRLGTWFGFIALAVVVFDHTHSALAVASLLIAGQVLPALLSPALVARVETSTRRGELTRLYLFEAVTTALLIVLRAAGTSRCRRCWCWSRSTARRRWRPARCCARPRARSARDWVRADDSRRPAAASAADRAARRRRQSSAPTRR